MGSLEHLRQSVFNIVKNDYRIDYSDGEYLTMINGTINKGLSKTVKVGEYLKINGIVNIDNKNVVSATTDSFIVVNIRLSKEKEFLSLNNMTELDFVQALERNQEFSVKIKEVEPYLIGSLFEAQKVDIEQEFYEQIEKPSKVYLAKILSRNRGGYLATIQGIDVFIPGSLAAPNKIIDFESLIGKTIPVMIETYLPNVKTFVASHKAYISYVLPEKIHSLDYRTLHNGIITGSINTGVFVEFNSIMTGFLSVNDMNPETLDSFNKRSLHSGNKISVYVKDYQFNKNAILTQNDTSSMVEELYRWKQKLDENGRLEMTAKVLLTKDSKMLSYIWGENGNIVSSFEPFNKMEMKKIQYLTSGKDIRITILEIIPEINRIKIKL